MMKSTTIAIDLSKSGNYPSRMVFRAPTSPRAYQQERRHLLALSKTVTLSVT